MNSLVVASMRPGAGKTSMIVGMAKAAGGRNGYLKPFGDRLLYRKKRLWDHDAAVVASLFGLEQDPEHMTVGFDHSKLKYMYDGEGLKRKLADMLETFSDCDRVFIEGGKDMTSGCSVNLDPMAVARATGSRLVLVTGGDPDALVDDCAFIKDSVDMGGADFAGVILNRVMNLNDDASGDELADRVKGTGIEVLGMIPHVPELIHFTAGQLADHLFAKVIAGEEGLGNSVKDVLVGTRHGDSAAADPELKRSEYVMVTSGDRSDLIVLALERGASAIVLTNNIIPPPNIIAKAEELKVPMLLVSPGTHTVAKQVDDMEPLLTRDEGGKATRLGELVTRNVNVGKVFG